MIIILVAVFAVGRAAESYVSQYSYVNEIREFYKKEIRQQLVTGKQAAIENRMLKENSEPPAEEGMKDQADRQDGENTLFGKEETGSDLAEEGLVPGSQIEP
ncbi:hypothetical protein [Siminovitchia fortis]|uniref:hypothetical protein n=1 Tax=Siminovitchia fortis TaxID=254758 RepID=UPI001643F8EB|nr:hypothetical protein [Siminovitchia fortis]